MAFAVVACSHCREPWSVELRHTTVSCPRCRRRVDLKRRTRLWQGDSAPAARAAAAALRAGGKADGPTLLGADPRLAPRHDSPVSAAAAKANAVINKGQKAEAIALWLTRLCGPASHQDHIDAMMQAGLDRERAEKEIVRMLANDVIFEPRAGHYQSLEA